VAVVAVVVAEEVTDHAQPDEPNFLSTPE